ncbi:MAG: glycosyltransferase family 9 protein [Pseudomonadota bacterium]
MTPEEESLDTPIVEGFDAREPYWVFIAGGKYDFTAKWWVPEYAQAVVDHFKGKTTLDSPSSGHTTGKVRFVQCGAKDHWHPELRGVENLIGKTSLRELIRLVYHARGVVCPVTFAMHLAAAVPSKTGMLRPCVVLSGGREPVHWVAYPGHECLNTIGQLPCCATFGCWRSRCQLVDDGDDKDRNNLCERPVQVTPDLRIAECMHMITPDRVIHAVERAEASLNRQDDALCRGIQAAAGASSSSESNQPLPVYRVSHDQSIWHTVRDEEKVTAQNARQSLDTVARLIRRLEGSAGYQAAASAGQGRGIVICAGGPKYLPCVWVCINMLRHHGCDLPVEVWHLGEKEMPWHIRESLMPLDTKCIDARMRSERYPARTLNGWEVKPYAILHSRFNEVLLLDADNVVARDPAYLFNDPRYLETGAVFWPDFNRFGPDQSIWQLTGIPYQDEPEFESGQILVNKSACWGELLLTMWFNEFSDFWYQHIHGDKDTFHLAWRRLNRMYAMPDRPIHAIEATMCQHDLQGMLLFMHRNFAKWQLPVESNRKIDGFQHEEACFEYLRLYEQIPQKSKAVVET